MTTLKYFATYQANRAKVILVHRKGSLSESTRVGFGFAIRKLDYIGAFFTRQEVTQTKCSFNFGWVRITLRCFEQAPMTSFSEVDQGSARVSPKR